MRTAKGGRGIRAEAWGFNLAETYPNQGLIIPVAWRERSKQRSVPQGSESYRGKEPTREMLLFGADRANNDGMRLWRCPRSRKPEGACPRWRVLDNRVDHRIDPIGIVMFSSGDLFPQPAVCRTVNPFERRGRVTLVAPTLPAPTWDLRTTGPVRGTRRCLAARARGCLSRMHLGPCALANRRPSMP